MKIRNTVIFLCLIPAMSSAEGLAVEKTNYSIGAGYHSGNNESTSSSVTGRIATPIGTYGGALFGVGYHKSEYDNNDIDSSSQFAMAELFVGDNSKGRAGVNYSKYRTTHDSSPTAFELDSDIVSIDLEKYFNHITLGVSRSHGELSSNSSSVQLSSTSGDYFMLNADYYYDNVKVGLGAGGMDMDEQYMAHLTILPEFMQRKAAVTLNYSTSPYSDDIGINFAYYFTDSVSLMERDRHY